MKVPRKRGRPAKIKRIETIVEETISEMAHDESSNISTEQTPDVSKNCTRKRGRPRKIVEIIEPPVETEEDSVYYDIPGEGSSDGVKDISDSESEIDHQQPNEQEIIETSEDEILRPAVNKRFRKKVMSTSEDNSNHGSTVSSASNTSKRKRRSKYENDDDFEVFTDEASNITEASRVTKSSVVSLKTRRPRGAASHDSGIVTRNKVNSRSTCRSAIVSEEVSERSEQSEVEESDFEIEESENEESEEEQAVEYTETDGEDPSEDERTNVSDASDEFDDDSDSIDIKYSPIKTRHARRRFITVKQMRGKSKLIFRLKNV